MSVGLLRFFEAKFSLAVQLQPEVMFSFESPTNFEFYYLSPHKHSIISKTFVRFIQYVQDNILRLGGER